MSKEERYAEHTVAWELPNGDSVTKSNYNLAGIETKYIPIQTEVINDYKDKQISDLKAKIAESERKNFELTTKLNLKEYAPAFCTLADRDCEALGQIERLKQQLAEKYEEIERLKELVMHKTYNRNAVEARLNYEQNEKAVEQLEKIINLFEPYENENKDTILCENNGISFLEYIDNQIASLKKGVE